MAISSARKHVCSPCSLIEICIFSLVELYIPYPVFFFQCLVSGFFRWHERSVCIVTVLRWNF